LVAEAPESNTVGYASASAAADKAWSTVSPQLFSTLDATPQTKMKGKIDE
jgi:hypothetical protein